MNEADIRHALMRAKDDPHGRAALFYSESGSVRWLHSDDWTVLWTIYEAALALQQSGTGPWEWMTLFEKMHTLFFDGVHQSFRRMPDGHLVIVEV